MKLNKTTWIIAAVLAIGIGIYPFMYLIVDMTSNGLLASKSDELLASNIYNIGFYSHILFGGIPLLLGWTQFSKKWRAKKLNLHRLFGKLYVITVLISGIAGLYISYYATGSVYTKLGFALLAIAWLVTTIMAYLAIKNKKINKHQKWMIRSYALTFAAVTLRLWLPILPLFGLDFDESYAIVAWLCWVPNLFFAELLVARIKN